MPWRVDPADRRAGVAPDPYRVWLSEVMLQQTTVAAVTGYFRAFTERWPDVHALGAEDRNEVLGAWAGLGYYARARNLHACAQIVSQQHGGVFPDTEEGLRALPGIGPYTAAAIAAIAFDRPATVVDGNVERVISRLMAIEDPLPDSKPEIRFFAEALTPSVRPGDYAQAVMDLGATICTPRSPACGICPWIDGCQGRAQGIAETLPRKRRKADKPVRRGTVWVALHQRRVLTCRRPDKGMLGGMLALPSTGWDKGAEIDAPVDAKWRAGGEVRHTFTHFHLILDVKVADISEADGRDWIPLADAREAMPTVFAKALDLAAPEHP